MEPWSRMPWNAIGGAQPSIRVHRRKLVAIGIAAVLLAVPVAVSANHIFSDVPTSSTYHTTVSRLVGAGITGGCGGGKYCPNAAVTRGQMAAFLNRGLGRAGFDLQETVDDDWTVLSGSIPGPAVTSVIAGGGTGGTGYVLVNGTVTAFTDEPGVCPCELRIALFSSDGEIGTIVSTIISDTGSPDDDLREGSASASHLFTVASGVETGFTILAVIFPTNTPTADTFTTDASFDLQATYVPFAWDGSNPPALTTAKVVSKPPFGVSPFPLKK